MWPRYLRIVVDVLADVTDADLSSCMFLSCCFVGGGVGVLTPSTGSVVLPEGVVIPGRDVGPGRDDPERENAPE